MLLQIPFPVIDPVLFAFEVAGIHVTIKWYGVAYVLGFLAAWLLLRRLAARGRLPLDADGAGELVTWSVLGVLLGGRLGYVLLYTPGHYLAHPLEIPQIWDGGMSFHGGMLGVAGMIWLLARRRGVPALALVDGAAVAVTPGLFFGRLANFVNQELWGRPTELPWAIVFTDPAAGGVPRHPSQIYEALLEGLVLLGLLWWLSHRPAFRVPGALTAAFVAAYGALRFLVEFAREPDAHLGTVLGPLSMGQLLCLAMIAGGGVWLARLRACSRRPGAGAGPGT